MSKKLSQDLTVNFSEIFAFEIDTKCKGGRLALIYQDVSKDN